MRALVGALLLFALGGCKHEARAVGALRFDLAEPERARVVARALEQATSPALAQVAAQQLGLPDDALAGSFAARRRGDGAIEITARASDGRAATVRCAAALDGLRNHWTRQFAEEARHTPGRRQVLVEACAAR